MTRLKYTTVLLLPMALASVFCIALAHAAPIIQRTYGGSNSDQGFALQRTTDGGLIMAGYTSSYGAGAEDFYLIKTDAIGNVVWEKTYGGAARDICYDVSETSDGGYILTGYTGVWPNAYDGYVVKVDAQGTLIWDNRFGGPGRDELNAGRETPDGGFIFCGDRADGSLLLIKVDANGDYLWQRAHGGGDDHGEAIELTQDGGFIISGWRGDGATFPEFDAWVLRTNSNGNIMWTRTLDSSIDDRAFAVLQTSDGGYAAAGEIIGGLTLWRFDEYGILSWQQIYGGPSTDYANDMVQTVDGGFLLGGNTIRNSQWQQYLVKTDATGALELEEIIGDAGWEYGWSVDVNANGDYAVLGASNSNPDNDYQWYLTIVDGPDLPSGVGDVPPLETGLGLRIFPNPARFSTEFSFDVSEPGRARIDIYDVRGTRLATAMDGRVGRGIQSVRWSARAGGRQLPSGVYFVRLEAGGQVETRKFVITR